MATYMTDLLIRQLPEDLHNRLKARARANRRSVTQEVLILLEQSLVSGETYMEPPQPLQGAFDIDDEWLSQARQAGRV